MAVAAPLPAEELREVVGARKEGVDGGSSNREQNSDQREEEADLPDRDFRTERDRTEESG